MPSKNALKKKPVAKYTAKPAARAVAHPANKAEPKAKLAKASSAVAKRSFKPVKAPVKAATKPVARPLPKQIAKKAANNSVKPVSKVTKLAQPEPQMKNTAKAVSNVQAKAPKNDNKAYEYKAGDKVVYPAHGVGRVEGVEKLIVAGIEVSLYTITFEKDRMRLKLPLQKVATSGLRRLATKEQLVDVYSTMKGRARIRRVMWSRRAQEYEAKINSGSPVQVAEVLRDLKRNVSSNEHSYSERQIFQQALERLASELSAIESTTQETAAEKLQKILVDAV